jgi:hypothetical protein
MIDHIVHVVARLTEGSFGRSPERLTVLTRWRAAYFPTL